MSDPRETALREAVEVASRNVLAIVGHRFSTPGGAEEILAAYAVAHAALVRYQTRKADVALLTTIRNNAQADEDNRSSDAIGNALAAYDAFRVQAFDDALAALTHAMEDTP